METRVTSGTESRHAKSNSIRVINHQTSANMFCHIHQVIACKAKKPDVAFLSLGGCKPLYAMSCGEVWVQLGKDLEG